MKFLITISFLLFGTLASAQQSCESLKSGFDRYNVAAAYFDRASRSETSALRAETSQSALTNILLRQSMVLDMMIAMSCELPTPPEFILMGLISSNN